MVFQNYALFPHLDVGENIAFGLRRRRSRGREIKQRVGEALELVHLAGYERRKPNSCRAASSSASRSRGRSSTGPRAPARRAARRARPQAPAQLQVELKRIQTEVGITFVYVTHDQEEALDDERPDRRHARAAGSSSSARPRSSTSGRRPASSPTSSARRTSCTGPSRLDGSMRLVRLDGGTGRPGRPGAGTDGRDQPCGRRPSSSRRNGRTCRGAIRGERRTGRLPRDDVQLPGPHGGRPGLSVLAPKAGVRLPVGSEVDRHLATIRGARPRRASPVRQVGGAGMSERHDGPAIDLEEALSATWSSNGSRGATCWSASPRWARPRRSHRSSPPARAAPRAQRRPPRPSARQRPSTAPTPDARRRLRSPARRQSCSSTTGPTTSARRPSRTSRTSTGSRSTTTSSRTPTRPTRSSATTAAATTCRFPTSVDIPAFVAKGALLELDKSLLPEHRQSRRRSGRTRATTRTTRYSVPYMWWTTGVGYDTTKIKDAPTSSKALWDARYTKHISMLDDYQETFAAGAHPARATRPTRPTRPSSTRPWRCSSSRSRCVRTYSTDTIGTMSVGRRLDRP